VFSALTWGDGLVIMGSVKPGVRDGWSGDGWSFRRCYACTCQDWVGVGVTIIMTICGCLWLICGMGSSQAAYDTLFEHPLIV